MNRTIISIEVQDHGGKEANIIVRGERNNQIFFEEQFAYSDNEKHPLRLHLLKEQFMNKDFAEGKSLGIMSIRKLLKDITEKSKSVGVPDYRTIDNYIDRNGNRQYFPKSPSEIRKKFNNDEQLFRKSIPYIEGEGTREGYEDMVRRYFRPTDEDLKEEKEFYGLTQ